MPHNGGACVLNGLNYTKKKSDMNEKKLKRNVRRGGKNRSLKEDVILIYSNIQGFTGKKDSLKEIIDKIDPDVCLFAETMTAKIKLDGCKSVTPSKSMGQNVGMLLRKKLMSQNIVKIYEPNDTVNMIGVRLELKNNSLRFFTAHLKQLSKNPKDVIQDQFEEIKKQFREANKSKEGMLLVFDSNVA